MNTLRPLETLIVQQLDRLIKQERSLATKYPHLQTAADRKTAASFSDEVTRLKLQADRLSRLLCAMESFSSAQA